MTKPMTIISDKQCNCSKACGHFRNLCVLLAATLLTAGCTVATQSAGDDSTYKEWKQVADDSAWAVPPTPDFPEMRDFHAEEVAALESSRPQPLPQIPVKNMVMTRAMDVRVLLRALADAADLNVVITEGVSGPILVSIRRETRWDRLFLAITEAHGLHYNLDDDLLQIFSVADVEGNIAMETALHDQLQAAEQRRRSEPTVMSIVRVRYADIEKLANSVRSTMQATGADHDPGADPGADPAGALEVAHTGFTVKADTDSGQLIIHGIPSDITQARQLIKGLDQPTYQILIEATIVQANTEVARQLGVQWGVLDGSNSGELTTGITPGTGGFNSNFPAGFDPIGTGFSYGASLVRGSQTLQAQLSALQKDGRLNIVSRPSITTLDQLTAIIESGEERPFASASGGGIAAVSRVEFKKAVLRLEVTPHVIDKNWVKLNLDTTKDDFDDTRAVIIDGNAQVPVITRSASTSLYLANGQTTVIGGLSSESKSLQEEGVPFLKNIPGLGGMFRNQADRKTFSDTLIFITPHILPQARTAVELQGK